MANSDANEKVNNLDNSQEYYVNEEPKRFKGKILAFILLPICAIYFGGVILFHNVFLPNTSFDGKSFSFKKPEAISEAMMEDTNMRAIVLKEIDGEETISLGKDIGYSKTATAPTNGWINKSRSWIWPKYLFAENALDGKVNIEYNEERFLEAVDNLKAMDEKTVRKPKDAFLERQGSVYKIVPEDDGNEIIKEKLLEVLKQGIDENAQELVLDELGCYTKAAIRSDDPGLNETYEKYKAINFQKISLDMTGDTIVLETPDILEKFYKDNQVSKEQVEKFVEDLQAKYDTYEEQRPFTNSYGYEIMVGTWADTYGFLLDEEATFEMLYKLLKEKKSEDTKPVWEAEGSVRKSNGSDIGDTYIEVCLADQVLWAYVDGKCVLSTNVVTGMYKKFDTPKGVFQILQKNTDTHLKGEEKLPDGKVEKWDSFVNYWMALTWTGVGLHNAPWRSAFGGNIYNGNGSHGCINMSYDAAQYLYNNFSHGTPTVIW
ncbi:MAG: L,D-transpeptidase/peptidoglycan binding protein [Firmicutes bacterium]|nr:L,D-transpeptidase/peptidoglycan binding protein [Bacillota bacterium]